MRFTLFLLLLIYTGSANAKDFYLDFDKAYLESWTWKFEVDSIIDARKNPEIIGYAYKGFPKRKKVAYLKEPLARELMPIFNEPPKLWESDKKIILRINHLYVYETRHEGKYGLAEANISFIEKQGNQYVELFQASGYFDAKGISMAKWHPQNIVDVLANCFTEFDSRRAQGKLRPRLISKSQLAENPYTSQRPYAIEKGKVRPKAVYHSFYDFRDNFPDTGTVFFPEFYENDGGLEKARANIQSDTLDDKEIYAFTYDQRVFVRGGNKFYEALDSNSNFYLDQHAISYEGYASGMIVSGILFGAVGVALYAAANTPQGSKDGYYLDLDMGVVLPTTIEEIKKINGKILLYNSEFNDSSHTIALSINDVRVCEIPRGDYYHYEIPINAEPHQVCVEYQNQKVCTEIRYSNFHTDVYLIRVNRKNEVKLDVVTTNLKESIFHDIKNGDIARVCPN